MKQVKLHKTKKKSEGTVMIQKAIRVFALVSGAAVTLSGIALQASTVKTEKFEIPFAFQVQNHKTLPAGEYRVEREQGSEIETLVNTKTGERVNFLLPAGTHKDGKAHLVFENTAGGHLLKQVS
jgi:hypothetical protein